MERRRQISDAEKDLIIQKHGKRCFIDGAPVGDDETLEFHHIKPYSMGGETHVDNIAPVCKKHHAAIRTMSLQEYRDKLDLSDFFKDGAPKYLDDLIKHKRGQCAATIKYEETDDNKIILYYENRKDSFPLYTCLTTGWKYFYAAIPVVYIGNDSELQPRALREASLWNLYRHFQGNTQLAPSICRIDETNALLLFDGQHKAAAQIWSGREMLECKVYVKPESIYLKETNLEAHGKFRQMSFYSHELMKKYADIFGEDWELYMETEGEKSELGFCNFLIHTKGKTKAKARDEIALSIYNELVDAPDNKLSSYLSEKNRGRNQPLTFARLKKTIFQEMLLTPPVLDEFESETDFRKSEKKNLIKFMNIIAEAGLEDKWNPERNDNKHKKAQRIFSAGAIRAWTILLKETTNVHLRHYTEDERNRFFYRNITDDDFNYIRQFVEKLFNHKIWDEPDPTGELKARLARDDAATAKSLFDEKGLTVNWLLGQA